MNLENEILSPSGNKKLQKDSIYSVESRVSSYFFLRMLRYTVQPDFHVLLIPESLASEILTSIFVWVTQAPCKRPINVWLVSWFYIFYEIRNDKGFFFFKGQLIRLNVPVLAARVKANVRSVWLKIRWNAGLGLSIVDGLKSRLWTWRIGKSRVLAIACPCFLLYGKILYSRS